MDDNKLLNNYVEKTMKAQKEKCNIPNNALQQINEVSIVNNKSSINAEVIFF